MLEQALGPAQLLTHPTTVSTVLEQTETNKTPLEAVQLAIRFVALRGFGSTTQVDAAPNGQEAP